MRSVCVRCSCKDLLQAFVLGSAPISCIALLLTHMQVNSTLLAASQITKSPLSQGPLLRCCMATDRSVLGAV